MDFSQKKLMYVTSTAPRKWKLKLYELFLFIFGIVIRVQLKKKFNGIEVIGKENLQGGPYLLLMNHSCALDPLLITFFGGKPLQFLISEGFMQSGIASRIAALTGQITKRKLDMDISSIKLMKQWCDIGGRVAVFPEGQFAWDGAPSPLMPGLDQLINHLNVPVVCVNLQNGSRVKPAWAEHYRKTKIKIIIHSPKKFTTGENILEYIRKKIFSSSETQYESEGINLSHGLAKLLRYCPSCQSSQSLKEIADTLSCSSCTMSWTLDANNEILNTEQTFSDLLKGSLNAVDAHWNKLQIYESINQVHLFDSSKKIWNLLSSEKLNINPNFVTIGNYEIPIKEILAQSMDWGEIIIIKTKRKRYSLQLPSDSRFITTHVLAKVIHV